MFCKLVCVPIGVGLCAWAASVSASASGLKSGEVRFYGVRSMQLEKPVFESQLKRTWSDSRHLNAIGDLYLDRLADSIQVMTHFEIVSRPSQPDAQLLVQFGFSKATLVLSTRSGQKAQIARFQVPTKGWACQSKADLKLPLEKSKGCTRWIQRLVDSTLQNLLEAIPYRGFVIESAESAEGKGAQARINLGEKHGIQYGQVLELVQLSSDLSTQPARTIGLVRVSELSGADEAIVEWLRPTRRAIPLGAKVSFREVPYSVKLTETQSGESPSETEESDLVIPTVRRGANTAEDENAVIGRYWFLTGFEQLTYGPIAVAPQYESQVFSFNSVPAGRIGFGTNKWSVLASFTSVQSTSETVGFADISILGRVLSRTFSQKGWVLSAGVRSLNLQVTDNVISNGVSLSGLRSQSLLSPLIEWKYRFVPRDRFLISTALDLFWPVYNSSVDAAGMFFSFGAGASAAAQLALTDRVALDLSARLRYLRRLVERQSASQERQSSLGLSLVVAY